MLLMIVYCDLFDVNLLLYSVMLMTCLWYCVGIMIGVCDAQACCWHTMFSFWFRAVDRLFVMFICYIFFYPSPVMRERDKVRVTITTSLGLSVYVTLFMCVCSALVKHLNRVSAWWTSWRKRMTLSVDEIKHVDPRGNLWQHNTVNNNILCDARINLTVDEIHKV